MQIFIKMKMKALYKDSLGDGHLILTPTESKPLSNFHTILITILCFPSVNNGFNDEKNLSCLCKLHLNSYKKWEIKF